MPPLQALVALHGLWVLVLIPLGVWALSWSRPILLALLGSALTALGLTALGIVVGREMLTWYPTVSLFEKPYLPQRILFVLATTTDLPVVQLLLTGIALSYCARHWRCRGALVKGNPHASTGDQGGTR
jgi:hypothetical protein